MLPRARTRARSLALLASLATLAGVAPAAAAEAPAFNMLGSWTTGYLSGSNREAANGSYDVTAMNMATGALSGTAETLGTKFTLEGTESGSVAHIKLTEGGYTAYDTLHMSVLGTGHVGGNGTFNSTEFSETGTGFWAEQNQAHEQNQAQGPRSSATVVTCNRGAFPGEPFECTAAVADSSGLLPSGTPTGTVAFTSTAAGFPNGASCTLTSNTGGSAFCVQTVVPATVIAAGTPVPVSASYSGDGTFAASAGAEQVTVGQGGEPEAESFKKIEECPVGETGGEKLPTPNALVSELLARAADAIPTPKGPAPIFCSYKAKYTKAEKESAHEWSLSYNQTAARVGKSAAGMGGIAGALALDPDPFFSKGFAAGYGITAAAMAYWSAQESERANQMASIEHDPPDPAWRTIAAPPRTSPGRLAKMPGLLRKAQAALHAYLAAILQGQANSRCVTDAINRASTALANKNKTVAAEQYRAGSRCAAANAHLAAHLPRLVKAAKPVFASLVRDLGNAGITARFRKFESSAAFRRKIAARTVAGLRRLIALPSSSFAQIEAALAVSVTRPPTATTVLGALALQAAAAADWGALEHRSSLVLAAAASL